MVMIPHGRAHLRSDFESLKVCMSGTLGRMSRSIHSQRNNDYKLNKEKL